MMTENERIRLVRKRLGLTMEAFGKKIGVAKNTISQVESGTNNVSNQLRTAIIREFNVNEEWLRTGAGGDEDSNIFPAVSEEDLLTDLFAEIIGSPADDSIRALASAFARLTSEQRRQAADLAKALADAYNK